MSAGKNLIQTVTATSGASAVSTQAITFNNVAVGDLLIVSVATTTSGATVSGISDGTNTWTRVDSVVVTAASKNLELWSTIALSAAATLTVTATLSVADTVGIMGREYGGIASATADAHIIHNANATALTSTASSLSTHNIELVIGYCYQTAGGNFTVGAGFTNLTNFNSAGTSFMGFEDQMIVTPSIVTATFTGSGTSYGCGVATFQTSGNFILINKGLRPHAFSPGLAR